MYLEIKNKELILLLQAYLNGKITVEKLNNFAWNIINYFSSTPKGSLPSYTSVENCFWYAIWQIQHIADIEHEKAGITKKELSKVLYYLNHSEELPKNLFGKRPK